MSVIIKGIEMPTDCDECMFDVWVDTADGGEEFCLVKEMTPITPITGQRAKWCPLAEIPTPHGRLIDADALEDVVSKINSRHGTWDIPITRGEFKTVERVLWEFPTIASGSADAPTVVISTVDTPTVVEAEE